MTITTRRRTAVLASLGFGLAALTASTARADRYRVAIGNLPPILVDDARTYATQRDPDPAAPAPASPAPTPSPLASVAAPVPVTLPPDHKPQVVPPAQPALPPVVSADPDRVITGRSAGEPTEAFKSTLANAYNVSATDEIRGMWFFYTQEPTTVSERFRVGNAVIRWMLAARRAPTGMVSARPDLLPADARRGTVRPAGGLPVRVTPWGEATGALIAEGATVELKPPAQGVWYRVTGPGPTGWVPGVWMELK